MLIPGFIFLIRTVFGLFIAALMLRLLLQWARANFRNPLLQTLMSLTDPVVVPARRFIPGYSGVDWALILLLLVFQSVQLGLLLWLTTPLGVPPADPMVSAHDSALSSLLLNPLFVLGLFWAAFRSLCQLAINLFLWGIVGRSILSFLQPQALMGSPLGEILVNLTEPALRPIRRAFPQTAAGPVDFAPLIACLILGFLASVFG